MQHEHTNTNVRDVDKSRECMGWHVVGYVFTISMSAAAFLRNIAFASYPARQERPNAAKAPMESMKAMKAEQQMRPKTQSELMEAAKSARVEAARFELLAAAAALKGTASEPEETGRGRTRLRERRDTRPSSDGTRHWKKTTKETNMRRLVESREKMKQDIVRLHKEKKEAAISAKREHMPRPQLEREETWNDARKATEEANKALRERITKARKEAAKKAEDKTKEEKQKKEERMRKEAKRKKEANIAAEERT